MNFGFVSMLKKSRQLYQFTIEDFPKTVLRVRSLVRSICSCVAHVSTKKGGTSKTRLMCIALAFVTFDMQINPFFSKYLHICFKRVTLLDTIYKYRLIFCLIHWPHANRFIFVLYFRQVSMGNIIWTTICVLVVLIASCSSSTYSERVRLFQYFVILSDCLFSIMIHPTLVPGKIHHLHLISPIK